MHNMATPRLIQCTGLRSPDGIFIATTKFVECPVVERVPARIEVLYSGQLYFPSSLPSIFSEYQHIRRWHSQDLSVLRARAAAAARTTAPFTTAWFCWRPEGPVDFSGRVDVFRSVASVASQYRDVTDSLKKRPNPKARKRQKAARQARAKAYS